MAALSAVCGENDTAGAPVGPGVPDSIEGRGLRNVSLFRHLGAGDNPNHAYPLDIKGITDFVWGPWLWSEYCKITITRNPWDRVVSMWDYRKHHVGLRQTLSHAIPNRDRHYYFSPDRTPIADVYLRYERLESDFRNLCRSLDLPDQELPRYRVGLRSNRDYRTYYSPELRAAVHKEYDWEIEFFGYEF